MSTRLTPYGQKAFGGRASDARKTRVDGRLSSPRKRALRRAQKKARRAADRQALYREAKKPTEES